MRNILLLIGAVVIAALAYLFFWPVPIEPVAWTPPPAPALAGPYAVNDALTKVERLGVDAGVGPEDVALDAQGQIYVGYKDGRLVRFDVNGGNPQVIVNTGGRPLGLDFDAQGNLIVADAVRGLLSIAPDGQLKVLATEAEGVPIKFADDVEVAGDGMIYFSDASSKFGYHPHVGVDDILEHGGHGRLLKYDPASGNTSVLLAGMQFANGVALAADESFVLVNQTGSYNVLRYWLKGEPAGSFDVFFANLPGLPDGITGDERGNFWLALVTPRNPAIDVAADKPWLRKLMMRLPKVLQPKPVHHAFVLALDSEGKVIHNLQDASHDAFAPITSAEPYGEYLYLGSLTAPAFARLPIPAR
ncbi:MAG: SMP-30/gluconolactonase/LRE family protein [Nevskiales bacterium]